MAQRGAADALSPVSRTDETPSTPRKATVLPRTTPAAALSPIGKHEEGTVVVEPAVGALSPPAVDSGKVVIGGDRVADAAAVLSPVTKSQKDVDARLRTAIKPLDYLKFIEHGEPIKEQERVSYQNMLVRYADWPSVRWQMLAYFLLGLIAQIYRGHNVASSLLTEVDMVAVGKHIHCCCDVPQNLLDLKAGYGHIHLSRTMTALLYLALFFLGGLSPLWERFIGRRQILLIMMIASVPASVTLIFVQDQHSIISELSQLLLKLCQTLLLARLAVIVTISSLIEMLPYETRYLSVLNCFFSANVTYALAALHFRRGYSASTLGWGCLIGGVVGAIITRFFLKDSICHLNIRNDVDVIEKIFKKREAELYDEKPEGGRRYHQAVARKIFEDLVYLDQDELKFAEFFKRLWRSFAITEIVLAFFQATSSGLHEFESNIIANARFEDPMRILTDKLLGFVFAGFLMYFLRKAHRNRAICILLAGLLLNSAAHHAVVTFDKQNRCPSIHVVKVQFEWLSMILSITAYALINAAEMMVVLHFLETTPSILRSSCALLIYMPMKLAYEIGHATFKDDVSKDLENLAPVYAYHLIIIIVTIIRTNSRLPFSLYLFDLMPTTAHERDGNCASHEKIRPIMEETAQPFNGSTEKERKVDEKTPSSTEKRAKASEAKSKFSLGRAFKMNQP